MERALSNLVILGEEDILKNRLVTHSLEKKLPSSLKEKWIKHKAEPLNRFSPHNHFDCLLLFFQKQEALLEEWVQLDESPRERYPPAETTVGKTGKKAFSKATTGQRGSQLKLQVGACTACSEKSHTGRLFACAKFREMGLPSKKIHLNANRLCYQRLGSHKQNNCDSSLSAPKLTAEAMNSTTTYSVQDPRPWKIHGGR